jgi:hypothetical protein
MKLADLPQHPVARRRVLQAMGLGSVASFLPALRSARAADAIPTRFVVFYSQHGFPIQYWKPTGPGGSGNPTETSFELGPMHTALKPYQSDLILLSGLDMRSWDNGPLQACGHINGQNHSLTNIGQQGRAASGPSIDQYVAAKLKDMNGGTSPTRVPSLGLSYGATGNSVFYSGPGQNVPLEPSASKAYARLFPNGTAPASDPTAALKATARRKSAMDIAAAQFKLVENHLGKADRDKLEAHVAMVRDLQTRLDKAPSAGATCTAPSAPGAGSGWTYNTDVMPKLIASALACDITRVATLMPGEVPDDLCGYKGGMLGTTDSHDLIHKVDRNNGPLINDQSAQAVAKQYHVTYANIFAKLVGALKAIPEADGKTVLDHTVVLWAGELAEGGHGCTNLRWMLAGGAGGYFKTGRYLSFGDYNRCQYCGDKAMPGSGDLFVSIANAMGVQTNTFGDPGACKGPIAQLRG